MSDVLNLPFRRPLDILILAKRHGGVLRWTALENGGAKFGWEFQKQHRYVSDFIANTVCAASEEWRREYAARVLNIYGVERPMRPGDVVRVHYESSEVLK